MHTSLTRKINQTISCPFHVAGTLQRDNISLQGIYAASFSPSEQINPLLLQILLVFKFSTAKLYKKIYRNQCTEIYALKN